MYVLEHTLLRLYMLSSSINFSGSFDTYTDVTLATKYRYSGTVPPFMKLALGTLLVELLLLNVQVLFCSGNLQFMPFIFSIEVWRFLLPQVPVWSTAIYQLHPDPAIKS